MPPPKKEEAPELKTGSIVFPNGDTYVGEYLLEGSQKYREGHGVYECFCEESRNNKMLSEEQRKAEVPFRNENDIVELDGEWIKDVFLKGEICFANGSKYQGDLDDIHYVSGGKYTFPDGTNYVGEYRDGQIHGKGSVNNADVAIYRNGAGPGL